MDIGKELRRDFEMSDKDEEHAQRERKNSQCNRTHNLEKAENKRLAIIAKLKFKARQRTELYTFHYRNRNRQSLKMHLTKCVDDQRREWKNARGDLKD